MKQNIRQGIPRLPLDGRLDLTYRCNNNCRHCWLWLSPGDSQRHAELSLVEIQDIVNQARAMGCQAWSISGGEPMLRPDFTDIFDYITRKSVTYSINTNGTLITPAIAQLLRRKGKKMVALYGATAEIHDHVTRTPGSFEATMRGFTYLIEAGVSFIVQIIPMQANYHQYEQMVALAQSLSPQYRIGAPWLWFSANHSKGRNLEIACQRLAPSTVIALDEPLWADEPNSFPPDTEVKREVDPTNNKPGDDRLFATCIASRRDFHIDPYGYMSFCYYIKDPTLRYNLRNGTLRQAWEEFIPSLSNAVHGGQEYQDNCATCELRQHCRWCGVYGFLEHGRYSAKVEYLCQVADQTRNFMEAWNASHIRYFQIAGITIKISADFPVLEDTFAPIYRKFETTALGPDVISVRLHSSIPELSKLNFGQEVYNKPPWVIYRQPGAWLYLGTSSSDHDRDPYVVAIFDTDHNRGSIFHPGDFYQKGDQLSLTTFVSDQIWLARVLADRQACYLHSSGIVMDGKGFLFVGHSAAGKSTMLKMLRGRGEILCDDRNIIRRWPDGFRIHGTWSHGELSDVSPASAPLKAILYLEQAPTNELIQLDEKREKLGRFLSHVVKPLVTADWWEKILGLAGKVALEVPAYRLRFDKSGQVVDLLNEL